MATSTYQAQRTDSSVGAFHAKTHFSQLLARVAQGEEITITKHDRPVARLVPAGRPSREHIAGIFREMAALRQALPEAKSDESLKDLINQGRRF